MRMIQVINVHARQDGLESVVKVSFGSTGHLLLWASHLKLKFKFKDRRTEITYVLLFNLITTTHFFYCITHVR